MKLFFLFIVALVFCAGCRQEPPDREAAKEEVMQTSRDWAKVVATGDVEKTLSYWADSAIVIQPGQPLLKGKKQIRQMVEASFKTPGFRITWEPQHADISQDAEMAWLFETSQITMNDSTGKQVTKRFNGVTVWKKDFAGAWKNVADIAADAP